MSPRLFFNYDWDLQTRQLFMELPFPISEYERRLRILDEAMAHSKIECILVVGDIRERGNVRWLTNFYPLLGQTIVVVARGREPIIVTTAAAHGEPMHSYIYDTWVPDIRVALDGAAPPDAPRLAPVLVGVLRELGLSVARFGVAQLSMLSYGLMSVLAAEFPNATFEDASRAYEECKAQKSDLEVAVIREAQAAGDEALLAALDVAQPGVSELEVAGVIELTLRRNGIETVSNLFDTRVCSGPRSFLKNAAPTMRRLRRGDPLFMDISAIYKGYVLDCCASTVVGGDPTPEQERLLECGARMAEACIAGSTPGTHARDLVDVVRTVAEELGEGAWFIPNMVGHGMGTSQVEIPYLNPFSEDILQPNQWYALECMVSDPARGTGQMEGSVLITHRGGEYLSRVPLRPWRDL